MSTTFGRRIAACAVSAVLLLSACGDDDGALDGTVVPDGWGCTIPRTDRPGEAPEVDAEAAVPDDLTEVATDDLVEGDEEACDASAQPYLTVDMVGVKASDGAEFVNTYGEERALTAQIGQGMLIPGLETGLAEMRVGGRRQIVIPADQAYAGEGNPAQGIGADETLVFVVDLVAVTPSPLYCNENQAIPPAPEGVEGGETKPTDPIELPVEPYEELEITALRESAGEEVAEGDRVNFHYVGISCASGQQFESSWDRGEPLTGEAGGRDLIQGMSQGLVGAKVGELRRVDIPADQAYGDDALTFLIEVVEVLPPEPEAPDLSAPEGGEATVPLPGEPSTEDDAPTGDAAEGEGEGDDGDGTTTTAAAGTGSGAEAETGGAGTEADADDETDPNATTDDG